MTSLTVLKCDDVSKTTDFKQGHSMILGSVGTGKTRLALQILSDKKSKSALFIGLYSFFYINVVKVPFSHNSILVKKRILPSLETIYNDVFIENRDHIVFDEIDALFHFIDKENTKENLTALSLFLSAMRKFNIDVIFLFQLPREIDEKNIIEYIENKPHLKELSALVSNLYLVEK